MQEDPQDHAHAPLHQIENSAWDKKNKIIAFPRYAMHPKASQQSPLISVSTAAPRFFQGATRREQWNKET
jgi:hypothetical protein